MIGLLIRWLVLTAAILAASYMLQGISVTSFWSALAAAAILGVLNVILRPIIIILTLPVNILTLGLFTFVINAALLMMVSGLIPGFDVRGFWPALWGSIIISIVSWLLTTFISDRGKVVSIQEEKAIDLKKRGNRWE
ncbi:MAG TPA: phage holin family protein [Syntrophales bacterium]|nr:phage holin family protein [Syntrophales bacterium]HOX94312.1 phage holin family protein [Syntrophales bacterium]HPI56165.1 phage holin family protein [Syntrophales bacterium]HPN24353.1 phage holin family protein [Syntrophales bacterium]HQM28983.1 phage holin family protein [Syntrophales bacterium]